MTNPVRISLFVAASVLATSAAWWRHSRHAPPNPAPTDEAKASSVGADLRELRAEVASLRRAQTGQQASSGQPAGVSPVPVAELSPEELIAKERKAEVAEAAALTRRLNDESIDTVWSAETESQIKTALRAHLPRANVVETRCARTLCRIVINHEEGDETMRAPVELVSSPPFTYSTVLLHEPTSLTLFVFRPGHRNASAG